MRHATSAGLWAGVLLLCAGAAGAQQVASAAATRRSAPAPVRRTLQALRVVNMQPTIDGRLDDAVWQHADVAGDFVVHEPTPGVPSAQRTEARVLYDEGAIYVGMRAFDTAPDSIVGQLARRDENPYSDWLLVGFDSYFDHRTAYLFGVNPAGARVDIFMYDDGSESDSWDPVWQVATTRDSLGWSAELRIPLSQLRFSGGADGARTWGVQFHRKIARSNERSFWAPMPRDANGVVSLFGELQGLAGLRPPRHLEVLPYTVSSVTTAPAGDVRDPFHRDVAWQGSAGADFTYGITSHITLNGTLNPDFGQVEADPSVVNLSAYETFLQERRPFFVEGADIFNFGLGVGDGDLGNESLFYSRRIGRAPQAGAPDAAEFADVPGATSIVGALKLSGKTAHGWSLGMLEAVTARETADYVTGDGDRGTAAVEPWTNYAVARVARDFDEGRTAFGAMATATNRRLDDRLSFLRSAAYTGGLNARRRWRGGDFEVSGWLAGSHVRGDTAAIARTQRAAGRYYQRPDAGHTTYDPTRTSLTGWAGGAQLGKLGGGHWRWLTALNVKSPGFEPNDLGFQGNADQALAVLWVGYSQYEPTRHLNRWNVNLNQWQGWTFGGENIARGGNINGGLQLRNFWGLNAGIDHEQEAWSTSALRGGPAMRAPGGTEAWLSLYSDTRSAVRGSLAFGYEAERQTDGQEWWVSPSASLRLGTRTQLSLSPSFNRDRQAWQYVTRSELPAGDEYVFAALDQTTVSLTARVNYTFTPALSLQFYAQPFISAGDYHGFMQLRDPRGRTHEDRFARLDAGQLAYDAAAGDYAVDADRDGSAEYDFENPDFTVRELRSNAVLRWEYRPGSTVYLVWSQGRSSADDSGRFRPGRDLRDLLGGSGSNVLAVKVTYWLGL